MPRRRRNGATSMIDESLATAMQGGKFTRSGVV